MVAGGAGVIQIATESMGPAVGLGARGSGGCWSGSVHGGEGDCNLLLD